MKVRVVRREEFGVFLSSFLSVVFRPCHAVLQPVATNSNFVKSIIDIATNVVHRSRNEMFIVDIIQCIKCNPSCSKETRKVSDVLCYCRPVVGSHLKVTITTSG